MTLKSVTLEFEFVDSKPLAEADESVKAKVECVIETTDDHGDFQNDKMA